jgi:hypothetical protein
MKSTKSLYSKEGRLEGGKGDLEGVCPQRDRKYGSRKFQAFEGLDIT